MEIKTANIIAAACEESRFTSGNSYSAAGRAQENLSGRTHYCDPNSLRYHHSRILYANAVSSGAFFLIVESCALDPNNTARGTRAILFDLFGTTVYRPSLDDCRRTREQAERDFYKWFDQFDQLEHYRKKLNERAARYVRRAAELEAAAVELTAEQIAA